jgi:hypothetical protein
MSYKQVSLWTEDRDTADLVLFVQTVVKLSLCFN